MIIFIIVLLVLGFTGVGIVAYDEYKKEVESDKVDFDQEKEVKEK